ncbi:MAG: hypothetical protein LBE10_01350 [Treponema sp.]|jgi:hypothetical protein|nr:hypothetical protein [Treponema sp.]
MNMKNFFSRIGIVVLVAAVGLSVAGCPTSTGGDDGGDIPAELVAVWYRDTSGNGVLDAGVEDVIPTYEFKSDGKYFYYGTDTGQTFSVSGDQITVSNVSGSVTFKIEGKKLTLTGSSGAGLVAGTYFKK